VTRILVIGDERLLLDETLNSLPFEEYKVAGVPNGIADLKLARQPHLTLSLATLVLAQYR
jgi:DNA-binding response OmpR family regulator